MNYSTLINHYQTNHKLMSSRTHKYSISDIDRMYPFERDLYIDMLITEQDVEEIQPPMD